MSDSAFPKNTVRCAIHVVSLHDADARRSLFAARAVDTTAQWAFFDAHRGAGDHLRHDPDAVMRTHGRALQPGELGCYSSHAALWVQLLADADCDQYIILEDDVIVDWRAIEMIAGHDFAAARHHYVRLYGRKPSPFVQHVANYLPRPTALIQFLGKPFGTQGYVITREGARLMLDACRTVLRPIDDQMDRFWDHGIPNLCLFPYPIIEEMAPSTIGGARFGKARARARRSMIARWSDLWAWRRARWIIRGKRIVAQIRGRMQH